MRNYKGNMLLIELVITLLFFSLSQVVILQMFTLAQQKNADANTLAQATLRAENDAECLYAATDADAALLALGYARKGDEYVLRTDSGYRMVAQVSRFTQPAGTLTTVALHAYQGEEELFTLPACRYRGGDAE